MQRRSWSRHSSVVGVVVVVFVLPLVVSFVAHPPWIQTLHTYIGDTLSLSFVSTILIISIIIVILNSLPPLEPSLFIYFSRTLFFFALLCLSYFSF
jgi:hypothetical protein